MRKVGLVLCPDFQVMCFVALSAFEIANKNSGETLYDLHVLSERGGKLRSSFGMDVTTEAFADDEFDTSGHGPARPGKRFGTAYSSGESGNALGARACAFIDSFVQPLDA